MSRLSWVLDHLQRGPLARNVGGAMAVQVALLVSGTLSARVLGPTNRGYLAILATWASTVTQIGAVGISIAATYYLASGRISGKEIINLLRGRAAIQVVTLTAVDAAIVLGYVFVTGAPILFAACVSLVLIPATLALDYGIALALGGRGHGVASGARAVGPVLYALGLTYLFLRGRGTDVSTLSVVTIMAVTSAAVSGALALMIGLRIARSLRPAKSLVAAIGKRAARREVLAFGRRGYIGYLSPTDSFRIDQLLVGLLLSPRVLGIYVVGAAFTNFTRGVAVNVGLSSTSEVARNTDPDEQRAAVRHTLALTGALMTGITLFTALAVVPAIPLLFGNAYQSSVPIAECLLVASWLLSMKRISVDIMRGTGEPGIGTRAEVINLVAFLIFAPPAAFAIGGIGVAAALALSTACGSVYLAQKMYRLGYIGRTSLPRIELSEVRAGQPSHTAPRRLADMSSVSLYALGAVAAAVIGLESSHLFAVAVGLATLLPLFCHARRTGLRNAFTQPSAVTIIVGFYLLVFPLRGLVIAASGYGDVFLSRGAVSSGDLVAVLLLASAATSVLVEAYYLALGPRAAAKPQPAPAVAPAPQSVIRLATLLAAISLVSVADVVIAYGGISGAQAVFLSHSTAAALAGTDMGVGASGWALFAVPATWCAAYVALCTGTLFRVRVAFATVAVLIVTIMVVVYGSRLNVVLAGLGIWVEAYYSGRRIPGRLILVVVVLGILVSQPLVSARSPVSPARISTVERYSRIAGYSVLDVALAIRRDPRAIRPELVRSQRWLDLPLYFVPSALWHGRPNLNSLRFGLYVARAIGTQADRNTGFPSTFIAEVWLIGGWPFTLIVSIAVGALLGWARRRLVGFPRRPSPAAVLTYAYVLTFIGWSYYKDGDILISFVSGVRTAVYLGILLLVTGVLGRRPERASKPYYSHGASTPSRALG